MRRTAFFFELRQLQKNYDLSDPEQKTAFHREIARKLCTFSEEVERENYIEAVAQKYHISFENSAGWWEPMPPRPGLHSL